MSIRKRNRNTQKEIRNRNIVKQWSGKLRGVPAFVIGNSPALNDLPVHLLKDTFTIGINRAFKKIPVTMLLWQDIELFYSERENLLKLDSILFSTSYADPIQIAYHYQIASPQFQLSKNPAILSGKGTSAPLAFQVAWALGCSPIILLGYDCQYRGEQTDFYGVNRDHKPHTLDMCSRGLKWIKEISEEKNIKTYSCNLSEYFQDTIVLESVLDQWDCRRGFEYYKNKLEVK